MNTSRDELAAQRDELLARLAAIRADLARGLDADSKEQAIQLENLDVLNEIARVAEVQLGKINQQLSEFKVMPGSGKSE